MKGYFNLFDFKQKVDYKVEVLAGLTVALALIPEAVAFSLIAGLSPLTGLYAAFTIGLVTAILGGATRNDFWCYGCHSSSYYCLG